ncbi:MAG: hypothetical protein KY441_00310 [Actinobacteria bacterium]|nr:hypothetical protein [Actinomycetota bacterium]
MALPASEPARPLPATRASSVARADVPVPEAPGAAGDDWAKDTADAIERVVQSVRGKTIGPLEKMARALVYGLLALIVGIAAAVLVSVALVRALDLAIPGSVWSAHAITGGMFCLAGLLLWRKRSAKTVKV